jgi:hypothetical protein
MSELLYQITKAYKQWEKTKDEKYKKEWYKLINRFHDFINT